MGFPSISCVDMVWCDGFQALTRNTDPRDNVGDVRGSAHGGAGSYFCGAFGVLGLRILPVGMKVNKTPLGGSNGWREISFRDNEP